MSRQEQSIEHPIELSDADAREFARLLELLLRNELPRSNGKILLNNAPPEPIQDPEGRALLVAKARALFAERKRRSEYFDPNLFGEPAWDMLLALYITDFAGGRQSIRKLVSWIGQPQTTLLRWINYLENEHLISREAHPRDRRAVLVDITERGRHQLDSYFSEFRWPPAG
jgi:DNA-binding MarR family transcriptional regulator